MRSHKLYDICVYNIAGYWKLEMELFGGQSPPLQLN